VLFVKSLRALSGRRGAEDLFFLDGPGFIVYIAAPSASQAKTSP
jgi:hypothetical protein